VIKIGNSSDPFVLKAVKLAAKIASGELEIE
jgi:hypothetical protein